MPVAAERGRRLRKLAVDPLDVVSDRSVAAVARTVRQRLELAPAGISEEGLVLPLAARDPDGAARSYLPTGLAWESSGLAAALGREVRRSAVAEADAGTAVEKRLVRRGRRWFVYSADGSRRLGGPYRTRGEAARRLAQVETFKAEQATATLGFRFDMDDPAAVRWAEEEAAALVVEIDASTREAIRALVVRALREGGHPRVVARWIRPLIGLHSRWAVAVLNYRLRLEARGFAVDRVETLVARYYAKLLRARSLNIARTEILRAANVGKRLAWEQARARGLLGTAPQKQWIAAAGACETCAAADGQVVAFDDAFSTALGNFEMPPAHPSCRCTAGLVIGRGSLG